MPLFNAFTHPENIDGVIDATTWEYRDLYKVSGGHDAVLALSFDL